MQYNRLNPPGGGARYIRDIEKRVGFIETRPSGVVYLSDEDSIVAEDPLTGVGTIIGPKPDGGYGLTEWVGDVEPPGQPSTPEAEGTLSGVTITWDGLELGGVSQPDDYSKTEIEYTENGLVWISGGTLYDANSYTVPALTVGTTYTFRLVSYDMNMNRSTPSGVVTAVPVSVVDNTGVQDALDALIQEDVRIKQTVSETQTTLGTVSGAAAEAERKALEAAGFANGTGTMLYQDAMPVGAVDTVWIDTNDSNKAYVWNGTAWALVTGQAAIDAINVAGGARAAARVASLQAAQAAENAGSAQTSANNKNKVWYLPTKPAGTNHAEGDVWFDEDDGYKIYRWNGADFIEAPFGTSAIAGGAVTNFLIASGIDAGKMTFGQMNGKLITSKSIETRSLLVSSTDNLLQEPDFRAEGISWTLSTNITYNATGGRASSPSLRFAGSTSLLESLNKQDKIPIEPLTSFRGSISVKPGASLTSGAVRLVMRAYTTATVYTDVVVASNTGTITAAVWTTVQGIGTVPAGTINATFFLSIQHTSTATITYVDNVAVTRASDGRLIVDGALDAKTITGALIQSRTETYRGIKISANSIVAYDASDTAAGETFRIDGTSGNVTMKGSIVTDATITSSIFKTATSGARVEIDINGFRAYDTANAMYMNADASGLDVLGTFTAGRAGATVTLKQSDRYERPAVEFNSGNSTAAYKAGITAAGLDESAPTGAYAQGTLIAHSDEQVVNSSGRSEMALKKGGDFYIASMYGTNSSTGLYHTDGLLRLVAGSNNVVVTNTSVDMRAGSSAQTSVSTNGVDSQVVAGANKLLVTATGAYLRAGSTSATTVNVNGSSAWMAAGANSLTIGTASGTQLNGDFNQSGGVASLQDIYHTSPPASTFTANVGIATSPAGRYYKVSSAAKFKLDTAEQTLETAMKILDVRPKTWFDKHATESYADFLNGYEVDLDTVPYMYRIPGVVAEDVEAAGLTEYVTYDADGMIESVTYDRLWTLLIPIVKKALEDIENLKLDKK